MGKKKEEKPKLDTALKDLFNTALFGEEVVKPENISEADSAYPDSVKADDRIVTLNRYRDLG